MTQYTGLCVLRKKNGEIFSVKVVDEDGKENGMFPSAYIDFGAQPPLDELPDQKT